MQTRFMQGCVPSIRKSKYSGETTALTDALLVNGAEYSLEAGRDSGQWAWTSSWLDLAMPAEGGTLQLGTAGKSLTVTRDKDSDQCWSYSGGPLGSSFWMSFIQPTL